MLIIKGGETMNESMTYSVSEAAQILGIGKGLLYRLVNEREIPALKLGNKRVVIPKTAISQMIQSAFVQQEGT